MKAYVYPGDRAGCGMFRLWWPAQAVAALRPDWSVEIVDPEVREVRVDINFKGQVVGERFPEDADLIVMQRPSLSVLVDAIPLMRARGVAVVIDMDDDMSNIHPNNPAFASLRKMVPHSQTRHPVRNQHSPANIHKACAAATMVTVSTPRLQAVYPNRDGYGAVLLRNCVPARYLAIPHVDSDLVGWGGAVPSHPYDLQVMGPAIAQHMAAGGRFETVGMRDRVGEVLGLPGKENPPGPGPVGLDEWPVAIARFGIGVAPIDAGTVFNLAKSHLKPLEYNALGVPCVASPSDEYTWWAERSGGGTVLAGRPRAWSGLLRALVGDSARRREMSEAGREAARANTIEGNAWRWAEAWRAAVDAERSRTGRRLVARAERDIRADAEAMVARAVRATAGAP